MTEITPIGRTDWRNANQVFGIKDMDRLAHIYCIGKTGVGKSSLLLNMAISDIERGNGFCIIDPHGDIAEQLLEYVPRNRIKDVVYFNATDEDHPIAFNPLHRSSQANDSLVASSLVGTFKKIWSDSWGPRLEHILRFSILSLLSYPRATLLDIQLLLTDPTFRSNVLKFISDQAVLNFWHLEFEKYTPQFRSEAIAPILNKVGSLSASTILRNIIGHPDTLFSLDHIVNNRKILVCNFSKGQIGDEACMLLGCMILTSIQSTVLFRSSSPHLVRTPFYVYVDEMQSFVTLSFIDILAEARKFGLGLFLTHQYIAQLDERIRYAIFGNVGTIITFRLGAEDAHILAPELYPVFSESDLVHLPRYSIYLKLMIDGATSKPFSAQTLPVKGLPQGCKYEIVSWSRKIFSPQSVPTTHTTGSSKPSIEQTLFNELMT